MTAFTKRNLKVFFRDRPAVFFSLLSSVIMIGLYVLFLGDVYTSDLKNLPKAGEMMDNWIMAGLLATASVSAAVGAFGIMVSDRALNIRKDFYSSPITRRSLAFGYVAGAVIIGFILSLVTLVFAEIYIVSNGGSLPALPVLLHMLLIILLTDLANTAMMFFIASFFAGNNAFSTVSTVIGTLIGFLTGIYLPIGMLPDAVQWVIKLFPTSHGAALLRQTMMHESILSGFSEVPKSYLMDFKHTLGVTFQFGSHEVSSTESVLILLATAVIFFALAAWNLSRKKKA